MYGIAIDVIGWFGAALVVIAYLLLTLRKIKSKSRLYQLLNLFGGAGVLINSAVYHAFPSVVINALWILIAIFGLYQSLS